MLLLALPLLLISLSSCKPEVVRTRSEVAESSDVKKPLATPARRQAFDRDDIKSIQIFPAKLVVAPWQVGRPRLSGTFPDKGEGLITEGIRWSLKKPDERIIIDAASGAIAATEEMSAFAVRAEFLDFEAEAMVSVQADKDAKVISALESATASSPRPSTVSLAWKAPAELVNAIKVIYFLSADSSKAGDQKSCVDRDGVTVIADSSLDLAAENFDVLNLTAGSEYTFLICAGQVIAFGDKKIARLGPAVVRTVTVMSPLPSP
jgi:hypothetical protein